jgi:quercetin dioxygenase-like cupin family protein
MVCQTEGNDSFIRSISCRECGPLPAGAGRDRGRIEHQHHNTMIRAYRLYTGADGNSHVVRGSVSGDALVEAESILFKETPAHASLDWHTAPVPQYVITLAGVLEFTTRGGETFTIRPGDVLLAVDYTGSGHKWRLINDEPWKRAYVVFKKGADTHFIPDQT